MTDEKMSHLDELCPVCGSGMMSIVSEEFTTEDYLAGYDECAGCGWSGVWTIPMAKPGLRPTDQN